MPPRPITRFMWTSMLACPKAFLIVLADGPQLGFIWFFGFFYSISPAQFPSRFAVEIVHGPGGMDRRKIRLAIFAKAQHALAGNHRRRTAARKTNALAPSCAFTIAGTRDVAHTLRQTMFRVVEQRDKTLRQAGNIACATGTRQPDQTILALHLSGIKISEAVHLGSAEKTHIDASGLQQAHESHHVQTLGCAFDIRRVGHGGDQLMRMRGADHPILEDP